MTPNAIIKRRRQKKSLLEPIKVAIVGSYVPNKCGIATFGRDLIEAMQASDARIEPFVIAIQKPDESWQYPAVVKAVVKSNDLASYRRAADLIQNEADYVLLQHEFGLFGGGITEFDQDGVHHSDPLGDNILALLDRIDTPIITTFHTVLERPDQARRDLTKRIAERSTMNIVMTETARRNLLSAYGIAPAMVATIPHGVPTFENVSSDQAKLQLGIPTDRRLLTVTGLIGPNKGIEDIIAALPKVLASHPQAYIYIIGETHPSIVQTVGEIYREQLAQQALTLGVEDHVVFINRYLPTAELASYYQASDLYLTLHRDPTQSASGTLAYAIGAGKVAISTPYPYAQELLSAGQGVLVPFFDVPALEQTIIDLLGDHELFTAIQRRARRVGQTMSWPNVAKQYLALTTVETPAA